MTRLVPHVVIDDFLPQDVHDALLDHALSGEHRFARSFVREGGQKYHGEDRRSWSAGKDLGGLAEPFRAALLQAAPALLKSLGMEAFEPCYVELELSAHRDGDYFKLHFDTFYGANRDGMDSDRVVTTVYYFHTRPRGFSGGEFAIHPIGGGEPVLVDPQDNRLLAIPAFAPHEVKPTRCPGDAFRHARFAVNAWLHRARPPARAAQ